MNDYIYIYGYRAPTGKLSGYEPCATNTIKGLVSPTTVIVAWVEENPGFFIYCLLHNANNLITGVAETSGYP